MGDARSGQRVESYEALRKSFEKQQRPRRAATALLMVVLGFGALAVLTLILALFARSLGIVG